MIEDMKARKLSIRHLMPIGVAELQGRNAAAYDQQQTAKTKRFKAPL
jgi:hypothetical protein